MSKVNLYQMPIKKFIKLQLRNDYIESGNCKKVVIVRSYKQHKLNCDLLSILDKQKSKIVINNIIEDVENKKFIDMKDIVGMEISNILNLLTKINAIKINVIIGLLNSK